MLDSMISTTEDPEIEEMLRHHKEETERQEQRLRERLDALGAGTSTRKEAQTIAALMKGQPIRYEETRRARTQGTVTRPSTWR
jgi:ferritin-like metal-binding protein YciE